MRISSYFLFTSKEKQKNISLSHSILLRGTFISQLGSGIYNFLPLGFRVLKKVWKIIEEEMDRIGALEIMMPILHPIDLWEKTNRAQTMDNVMFKFEDKKGAKMVLATTHEEVVTNIVAQYVKSYKNLPLLLYQIGLKFRDEIRPKGGLIRAREFIMKDLYSFHSSWECLDNTYKVVYDAYNRIFERLGLRVEVVEAFSGPIGGDVSHEFMVVTNAGEDKFAKCINCNYTVSTEIAKVKKPVISYSYKVFNEIEKVFTPSVSTVEQLANYLKMDVKNFVKSILYKFGSEYVLVLVRGDKEVNDLKLSQYLGSDVILADKEDFERVGSVLGFIGPVNLKQRIRIIADYSVVGLNNIIVGANEKDYHYVGLSFENIPIDEFADLSVVIDDDVCVKCGGQYKVFPALELGHIFKLGTKYSEPLGAYYNDKDGKLKPMIMGCYGIGVSRIISAILESYSTEDCSCWTLSTSPFLVYLLTVNIDDDYQYKISLNIYNDLISNGIEVLWDDRKESPGFKFKDWDLLGIPFSIIVGSKVKDNKVEIKVNKNFHKFFVNDIPLVLDVDISEVVQFFNRWRSL